MQKLYTFLIFSLLATFTSAQITLETNTLPEVGDELIYTAFVGFEDTTSYQTVGEDLEWTFEGLNATGERIERFEDIAGSPLADSFPDANMLFVLGGFEAAGLRTDNTLEVIGVSTFGFGGFGVDTSIDFEDNYLVEKRPLAYGESFSDNFNLVVAVGADLLGLDSLDTGFPGATLDSIRVTTENTKTEEAVGWGVVNVEGASYEVLQVKQTDDINTTIEIGVGLGTGILWLDAGLLLGDMVGDFAGPSGSVTYKFLAPDTKTSIIEFTENRAADTLGVSQLTVTGVIDGSLLSDVESLTFEEGGFNVFPNPVQNQFIIEQHDVQSQSLDITILDMTGKLLYSLSNYYPGDVIDVADLDAGILVVQIRDRDNLYVQKLVVR